MTPLRRRVRLGRGVARLALCGALLLGCCAALPPAATAGRPAGAAVETYAYGAHARQALTVHRPPGGTPGPGLMIVHGGYWAYDTDWSGWARTFAARGFTVFDVDYRLNSDARWPAQRDDVLAALGWVRRNAARLALTGDRLVLLGSSAGGQIATNIGAYGAGGTRVAGVIALSPVASPYQAWLDGGRAEAAPEQRRLRHEAARLAGCEPVRAEGACRRVWRDMAARGHASGADDAPMYLLHSAADFVPAGHAWDLAAAERSAGMAAADVTVAVVPGGAHGAGLLKVPGIPARVADWARARMG
ncbi:alpha/beta hydrolase [Streptomyces sp. XD-27]|uniref:alpha/beta hydrolase fold domain-containing protein n=1 Tax=Streptomyces sp. XD-27 TaxID=3062779 RepID=UPI0026F43C7E|nr:alpha/beta hydrolase [Streptomyces sp. XD-27]WKX70723.1 alpha/beta hydrolase [Streptomyces sp. XD-27]